MTRSKDLALFAAQAAVDASGYEPVVIDVTSKASYTDYLLIVSGLSSRQVESIAERMAHRLKEGGYQAVGSEGQRNGHWCLLDYGDLVIHVFHHPERSYYDLEGLWSDAPRLPVTVPKELRLENLQMGASGF